MAIIIPSSHIYENKNQKVVDNLIKNVSFNENTYVVSKSQLYVEQGFNSTLEQERTFYGEWTPDGSALRDKRYRLLCYYDRYDFYVSSRNSLLYETIELDTTISTTGNVDKVGNLNYHKISVPRKQFDYEIVGIPRFSSETGDLLAINRFINEKFIEKQAFTVEKIDLYSFNVSLWFLSRIKPYIDTRDGYFEGKELKYDYSTDEPIYDTYITDRNVEVNAGYNSTTIEAITVGEEGVSFSLEDNELLQFHTTIKGERIGLFLSNKILNAYKNGKETATVLCDIGEYYINPTTKAISTIDAELPMTFDIGDEVIPMIYGADGKDHPMSTHKDGSAKTFKVLGTNIFYDGAVWQELTLQEI